MAFHPSGLGSSEMFYAAPWLDFNTLQTSHYKPNIPGYVHIERLYRGCRATDSRSPFGIRHRGSASTATAVPTQDAARWFPRGISIL
jgi:hypothetical protein